MKKIYSNPSIDIIKIDSDILTVSLNDEQGVGPILKRGSWYLED